MIVICNKDNNKALVVYSEAQWLEYSERFDKPNFSIYRLPSNLSNSNISGGLHSDVNGNESDVPPWTIEMVKQKAKEIIKE